MLLHSLKHFFLIWLQNYSTIFSSEFFPLHFLPYAELPVEKTAFVNFSYFYFSCYHLPYVHKLNNFLNEVTRAIWQIPQQFKVVTKLLRFKSSHFCGRAQLSWNYSTIPTNKTTSWKNHVTLDLFFWYAFIHWTIMARRKKYPKQF